MKKNLLLLAFLTAAICVHAQTFLVPETGNTIVSSCGITVKDAGGDNNIPSTASGSLSICPTVNGQKVHIDFSMLSLGNATLRVRNGSLSTSPIIATITGSTQSLYSNFTSTDFMGCLTLECTGGGSSGPGFIAQVSCVNPYPPCDLGATLSIVSVAPFYSGESFVYTLTEKNLGGTGPATAHQTRLYLSTDSIYDVADILVQTINNSAILQPGQSSIYNNNSFNLSDGLVPGSYYLLAYSDFTNLLLETNENNNIAVAGPVNILAGTRDFYLTELNTIDSVALGFSITGYTQIFNYGTQPSGSGNMYVYLSTDTVPDANDIPLDTVSFASILGGQSTFGSFSSSTLPNTISPGSYYIVAYVDKFNIISESNENNNIRAKQVILYNPYYDFSPQFTSVPSVLQCNVSTSITIRVYDLGKYPVTKYLSLDYYLSHDTLLDVGDALVMSSGSINISSNGGNVTLTPSLNLPDFTASGNYFLLANVDGENDYSEVNELNNTTYAPVTVQAISYDFLIDTINITDTLSTDSATTNSLPYTGTWSNQGTSSASSVRMRIYLSTDTILDAGDDDLSWTSANFTGVSTQNLSGYVNIPNVPEGNYYILFIADDQNIFFELNENNNVRVLPLTIIYKRYDYTITGAIENLFVANVRQISIPVNIIYRGTTPNNSTNTIKLYLSNDNLLSASDSLLGTRTVNFKGNDDDTTTINTTAPNVAPGNYFLLAMADPDYTKNETNEQNNLFVLPALIQPDTLDLFFQTASISNNATIASGSQAIFSGTIRDTSITSSRAFGCFLSVYTSTDTFWQPSDILIGTTLTNTINPNSSVNFSITATIPVSSVGHPYVIFRLDTANQWHESNEQNNIIYRPVNISLPVFNMFPYSPTASGGNIYPTSSINVTCQVGNTGNATTPASNFRIYLSTDTIFNGGDVQLYSVSTLGIFPGSSQNISTSVYMNNAAPGNYYLLYVADATNMASESNEADNVVYLPLTIIPSPSTQWDIVVTGTVSGAAQITRGNATNHYVRVRNQSLQSINCTVRLYLSTDSIVDAADVQIGTASTSSVGSNNSSNVTISGTIPANTTPGSYYLLSWADATNLYIETNEANNYGSIPIVVIEQELDLYPLARDTSYNFVNTASTSFQSMQVANFGLSASPAYTIGLYLSTDSIVDGADILLTTGNVSAMPVMSYTTVNFSGITFPSVTPGNYYFIAFVDNQLVAAETNENNNLWIWPATVSNLFYDISFENISLPDTSLVTGQTFTITGQTVNLSNRNTTSFLTVGLLSVDSIPDAGDVVISPAVQRSLSLNQTVTYYGGASIPAATAPGNYYVIAFADNTNTLAETNETNNYQSVPVTISPGIRDVLIDSFVVDTTRLRAGGPSSSITYRVRNNGNLPLSNISCRVYLSTDSVINVGDVTLSSSTTFTLSAENEERYFVSSIRIPNTITAGSYYLLTRADDGLSITEADETNNLIVTPITVLPLQIDLGVSNFYLGSPNDEFPTAGQNIRLYFQVSNYTLGSNPINARAKVLISNDTLISASDVTVYAHNTGSIYGDNDNNPTSFSTTYILPGNITPGLYYFIYWVDTANANNDPNLANNRRIIPFYVVAPDIDLYPSSVVTSNGYFMPSFNHSISITNNGRTDSGPVRYSVYLSADSTTLTGLYRQSTVILPALSTTVITLPYSAGPSAGLYYLVVKVDDLNEANETNENNNRWLQRVSFVRYNSIHLLPDSSATQNSSLGCYDTISFDGTSVHNPPSQHTVLRFRVSNGSRLAFRNFSLTGSNVLNIYSGYSISDPLVGSYTATNLPGIILLPNDSIMFELIANNSNPGSFESYIFCGTTVPDLEISQTAFSYDTIVVGYTYSLNVTQQNIGNMLASSSQTFLSFSADSFSNGNELYLSNALVPSLSAGGGTHNSNITFATPNGFSEGHYYLLVKADGNSSVMEQDENNNVVAIPIYYQLPVIIGIDELKKQNPFTCRPNLSTSEFYIWCENDQPFTTQVYNSLGQKIQEKTAQNNISLQASTAGVYFVVVYQGKEKHTFKVVIQ